MNTGLSITQNEGICILVINNFNYNLDIIKELFLRYNFKNLPKLNIQIQHQVSIKPPQKLFHTLMEYSHIIKQNDIHIIFQIDYIINSVQEDTPQLFRFVESLDSLKYKVIILDTHKYWILDPCNFGVELLE